MKTPLKTFLVAVLSVAVVACASTAMQVSSLRDSSVSATDQAPTDRPYVGSRPGQHELIARTFREQPPLVPHATDGYDEITATENACLDCHISNEFKGKKMPRVSNSHLVRTADAKAEPALNMTRWQCNSCHVPQVDARPLVDNAFSGNVSAR